MLVNHRETYRQTAYLDQDSPQRSRVDREPRSPPRTAHSSGTAGQSTETRVTYNALQKSKYLCEQTFRPQQQKKQKLF